MTEQDYIRVSNLVRLRNASRIITDLIPVNEEEEQTRRSICIAIGTWVAKLERRMAEDDDDVA